MRTRYLIAFGLVAVVVALYLAFNAEDENATPVMQSTSQPAPSTVKAIKKQQNVPPSFDVVRINPEGDTVMAGRATGLAEVTVLDSDQVLGTVKADDRGEWVFLPTNPLEPGERELSLGALNPDGSFMTSKDVVILVVPEQKGKEAIVLSMPRDGSGTVTALQVPDAEALVLSINAVNYDDEGNLSIAGQAPEEGVIYLYLDQEILGNTIADDKGRWEVRPTKKINPGVYQLRADHVDENLKVINRVTIPFSPATQDMADVPEERRIVVQPGNSLWRIARRVYGSGFEYAVIYRANESQISDPDLIYPGQVFEIPASE